MKKVLAAMIAGAFAVTAFAAEPAKKEEKKDAKAAATAKKDAPKATEAKKDAPKAEAAKPATK